MYAIRSYYGIRTLVRAINARRGLRRKDERPPEDHWAVRDEEMEQKLLSKYYMFKGFNREGSPTEERLEELGLDFVANDLIERGILREEDNFTEKELAEAPENNIFRGCCCE